MNKFSLLLFAAVVLSFSVAVFSQTPSSTPPENPDDVVKISTSLIQIDVTVTDKKGNQVTDLKPEDFEIQENGEKQDITNFSYMSLGSTGGANDRKTETTTKTRDSVSVPLPPSKLRPEQVRRTYALIVDDLGVSFENIYWIKKSLKKFINEQMQPGDLVAILRVTGGIGALQAFTNDKRILLAAVDKIRWNGSGRVGVNSYDQIRQSGGISTSETLDNGDTDSNKDSEAAIVEDYNTGLAVGTVAAMRYVIRGMRDLPGRKSLMFFSEGFQTFEVKDENDATGNTPRLNRIYLELRALAELANRSSVVIYTIDPRGLTVPANIAQAADFIDGTSGRTGPDPQLATRDRKIRSTQDSLRYLARETGGIPYVEQNDMNYGIRQSLEDQKGYYLIGYQPDSETFDPKKNRFNKLTIKVKRPDLNVRYRSGFFGVTDESYRRVAQNPQQELNAALLSPFSAADINLELYSIFYNDERDRNLIRSFVYIDPKDLSFAPAADGSYQAKFDVTAAVFDSNGAAATNNINSQELKFTKEQLAAVREKGIIYNLTIPVTKTGAYQFRIALRDTATGKIGAASQFIEIPKLDKKQLTLSNLIVKGYSLSDWKKVSLAQNASNPASNRMLLDTVTRQFKAGSVLTFLYVIYNAKTDTARKPQLQLQTRLLRDGKIISEGAPSPIRVEGQNDLQRIEVLNAVTLGTDLPPGDYALQIIVADKLAKGKHQFAVQSVDFEIVQ